MGGQSPRMGQILNCSNLHSQKSEKMTFLLYPARVPPLRGFETKFIGNRVSDGRQPGTNIDNNFEQQAVTKPSRTEIDDNPKRSATKGRN